MACRPLSLSVPNSLTARLASSVVATALLSACATHSSQGNLPALNGARIAPGSGSSQTFTYTGKKQTFVVPSGVSQVKVVLSGASGANTDDDEGGKGGRVTATIPVEPGESLAIVVGGQGGKSGGFNGGASGGQSNGFSGDAGGAGGGASDVREGGDKPADRILIAGGGGGAGGYAIYGAGRGGKGGGSTGGAGARQHVRGGPDGQGGAGGTQSDGGKGGHAGVRGGFRSGHHGHRGTLGHGGSGGNGHTGGAGGGGGGGGYYGGGGGGAGSESTSGVGGGGGGGGGSSYIEESAYHTQDLQGAASRGNGKIIISW